MPNGMPNGGALQAQGEDMNPMQSWPWAQPQPLARANALEGLAILQGLCTTQQLRKRDQAFRKAEQFIHRTTQVQGPWSFPFQNRGLPRKFRRCRVDIDVRRGLAFVAPWVLSRTWPPLQGPALLTRRRALRKSDVFFLIVHGYLW